MSSLWAFISFDNPISFHLHLISLHYLAVNCKANMLSLQPLSRFVDEEELSAEDQSTMVAYRRSDIKTSDEYVHQRHKDMDYIFENLYVTII